MARAKRVCSTFGCPNLTDQTRCPTCRARAEQLRGTRQQRGYDAQHDAIRLMWAARITQGDVNCARCGQGIAPDAAWDLDHTDDRRGYLGPSHAGCNRATNRGQSC